MKDFLTRDPIKPNEEEREDIEKRKLMDEKRIEEQKQFYEIARQRAKELDVYMERFRRDIVESSKSSPLRLKSDTDKLSDGLTKLFQEIRDKDKLEDLSVQYKKFAEWLRIEYADHSIAWLSTDAFTESPPPSITSFLPKTIPLNYSPRPSVYIPSSPTRS